MKKIFFTIVCTFAIIVNAKGNPYKDIRLTYLWDVTLSIKGYNGSPNIYDAVLKAMIKDIEAITNERTEIINGY